MQTGLNYFACLKKIVIIPTYNEMENISRMLRRIFSLDDVFHVLVIDDGSPDGTADIVREMLPAYADALFLEERSGKLGLGTAYIHGFRWAIARGYDYIFEMDADFSHHPEDLERLYAACDRGGADVAVGSRYVRGGRTENWPWDRSILSYGASVYVRFLTWMPVKDPTAGFICYKRKVLESIEFDQIRFVGYAFQIEMKFTAWKLGFKVVEVPITFTDREQGQSKMSKGIIKEGVLGVLKMQYQTLFQHFTKKIRRRTR